MRAWTQNKTKWQNKKKTKNKKILKNNTGTLKAETRAGNPNINKQIIGAYMLAHKEGHSLGRVWYCAIHKLIRCPLPDCNCLAFPHKEITSTTPYSQRSQASLSVNPTPPQESLGRFNPCGSKTYQTSYGHPRCNLSLVRLVRLSPPLPVFGRFLLFPYPRDHKPETLFAYCLVSSPGI